MSSAFLNSIGGVARFEYWRKSKVAVLGGGNWGTVLAQIIAEHVGEVRLWVRDEETARAMSATRQSLQAAANIQLHERIRTIAEVERIFEGGVPVVIWALPASVCRQVARELAPLFLGSELVIHATKGLEAGTLKRVSEVLVEELPTRRVGVISGPNLAAEIARGEPAVTVIASPFDEVREAGRALFETPKFRVLESRDVAGVEWAGALKNVLAIAAGALDASGLGANSRAWLLTRGLGEILEFAEHHTGEGSRKVGSEIKTFLGPAGMGDLLATCGSPLSRNYQVGFQRAKGTSLELILKELGSTAEGVETARKVVGAARESGEKLIVCEAVLALLEQNDGVQVFLDTAFGP